MSSTTAVPATCPHEPDIQDLRGRVATLEQQNKSMLNLQTETLAEVRGLREDFQRYGAAISNELTRIYDAVMGEKVRPGNGVDEDTEEAG